MIKDILISEENYFNEMDNIVRPYLAGFEKTGKFKSFDEKEIFYRYYLNDNAKASVVVCHGFTENSEKFLEMIYYYHLEGYNVFALDHRGHGYSYREVEDTSVSHINKFEDYVEDLNCFVEKIVKPESSSLPLFVYAHSMGGAVAVLYLMKYPDIFEKAVLTAPMIFPQTQGVPVFATKLLTSFFKLIGMKKKRVFVQKSFDPKNVTYVFEMSNATSRNRFDYIMRTKINNKFYFNSCASYNWVRESLKITKIMLNPKNCDKIKAKVFLFQGEIDNSVRKEYQPMFVSMVKDAKIKEIKGSKHEIYLSPNDVLEEYLTDIFEFLE